MGESMTAEHLKKLADESNRRRQEEKEQRDKHLDDLVKKDIWDIHWQRIERQFREVAIKDGKYLSYIYSSEYYPLDQDRFLRILSKILTDRGFHVHLKDLREPYMLVEWSGS